MSPKSQRRRLMTGERGGRGTFSAWAMAIAFATVAMLSFAVDQAVVLVPVAEGQPDPPSLLHPVQLIESLLDAASE